MAVASHNIIKTMKPRSKIAPLCFGLLFLTTGSIFEMASSMSSTSSKSKSSTVESTTNSFDRIAEELQQLADNHGLYERSRNKLQPRHMAEFPTDSLFHRFSRCVCQVAVIPRKELFETWAMAAYVHHQFPWAKRIADLACSHGLLSWALLLLARNDSEALDRTCVCIDLKMPISAEKIAEVMLKEWPQLRAGWDYVEAPLEALEPDASTLLVGIHACGTLSDKIVGLAIKGNAPLALVPCCHSKKSLTLDQKADFGVSSYTLAEFIDFHRIQRLKEAGYLVSEATIPEVITPKNRIVLSTPPKVPMKNSPQPSLVVTRKGILPWAMPDFAIPVADSAQARDRVRALAGRLASRERKQNPPVAQCVSFYLPPDNVNLSPEEVKAALPTPDASVEAVCAEPFFHTTAQRYARTFRVTYPQGVTKAQAKQLHKMLRERIPRTIPGAQVRY